ncbi:hypothetical protein K710_0047 [Streptococcus iniae SF1]|nr:hypothetical protein K710_0047 [Streptococcus iniae SF1]
MTEQTLFDFQAKWKKKISIKNETISILKPKRYLITKER